MCHGARLLLAGLLGNNLCDLGLLGLGHQDGVDVGEDSTGSDGDSAKKLVELLVVLDSKGDVPGDNPGLLVVAGGVSGELEDLSGEVLEDGGEVDRGAGADAGGVLALLEVARDAANRELEPGLGGPRLRLLVALALAASFTTSFSFAESDVFAFAKLR